MIALYRETLGWFGTHWQEILVAIGTGIVLFFALHFLKSLGKRLCSRDASGRSWGTVFGRAISRTGNFFIAAASAEMVVRFANSYMDAPGGLTAFVHTVFMVAAVFQGAIWARELTLGAIEHRTSTSDYHGETLLNAMGLIRVLVTIALFAIALVVVLSNLGFDATGLIAGLGVGGIAIGLAAQGIFADLFAALAIIFDRPFKTGDAITYDKSSGEVEAIGMKSTRIRGTSGEERIISNKKLLDYEIINNTQREFRRTIFTLGIVQTTSVEVMENLPHLLKEIVESHDMKFVRSGFVAFGAQSYDFEVQFDTQSPALQDMYDARHSIGLAIIRRFNEEGIALAYPTQTSVTAEEAGLIKPKRKPAKATDDDTIDAPPSSGDRSAADQEGGA